MNIVSPPPPPPRPTTKATISLPRICQYGYNLKALSFFQASLQLLKLQTQLRDHFFTLLVNIKTVFGLIRLCSCLFKTGPAETLYLIMPSTYFYLQGSKYFRLHFIETQDGIHQ